MEQFSNGKSLLDFWRWAHSDIIGNSERGRLAEYIVAMALGIDSEFRMEWDSYDLITDNGIKIEVKSSGYLQTWGQKKLSIISFGIQPTKNWDSETNIYSTDFKRRADIYVFAVFNSKNVETANPLNMDQWEFYVLSTEELNKKSETQQTIRLNSLIKLPVIKVDYCDLRNTIYKVYEEYAK